jgi:HAMP domain-containing protein
MMEPPRHRNDRGTKIRISLAVRLALVFGLISAVTISAMGIGVYLLTTHYLRSRAADNLGALARFYAAYTAATAPDEDRLAALAPQIASFFAPQGGYDVRLFSGRNGSLLATTRDIGALPSNAALSELGHRRPTLFLAPSHDQAGRLYAAETVMAPGGAVLAVVEVSRSVEEMETLVGTLRLVLLLSGIVALVAVLVASFLLAQRVTSSLRDMEESTQAIARGDFTRRLAAGSGDEIGHLATSINTMAADLARLEASRRDFMAKISHDLRTPLTAIKGTVVNLQDTAPDDMQAPLRTIEEQVDHLSRLVTDLLTLSRLQRGELQLRCTETNLAEVARSAASLARQRAQRLGVDLTLKLPDGPVTVYADAGRLQQVTVNLLDNALRATPAGGSTRI